MGSCNYKFQDKDKFGGDPYCTFFNEKCNELDFICDENCQVYENEKELKKYKEIVNKIFDDDTDFCEQCCAKGRCNNCCCYEQLKEMFAEVRA